MHFCWIQLNPNNYTLVIILLTCVLLGFKFKLSNPTTMKNKLLISVFLLCFALLGYGQEPAVKILAMPDFGKYDQMQLKNGTTVTKVRINNIVPGEKIVVLHRRKLVTYRWDEIQQVGLTAFSLERFSANWGKQITVICDPNALKDVVVTTKGQTIEGTLYEFSPFYRLKIQENAIVNKKIMWDNIEKVVLAKASPFLVYSTDAGCRKGSAPDKLREKTDISVSKSDGLQVGYETELSSDQIRKSWEIRGGTIFSKEYNISLSMMTAKSAGMDMTGIGYGMNGALNLINLTPPSYPDNSNATVYKAGANAGLNNFFLNIDAPGVEIKNAMQSTFTFGMNFGLQQAMGKFSDSKTWKGLALGFGWRPTYQFSSYSMQTVMTIMGKKYTNQVSDSNSDLNLSGFEFYFDFVNMNAITSRFTKPAHFKLNFFFLPPMGDMKMTFIQIGLGVITY